MSRPFQEEAHWPALTDTALILAAPDVDAVAGWLGSYGGEDSPGDISRGCFAAEVGVPRLLKLYKKYGITTTWFIPGHSLESFPKEMAMIRDAGHEIGLHGYSHENRELVNRSIAQVTD